MDQWIIGSSHRLFPEFVSNVAKVSPTEAANLPQPVDRFISTNPSGNRPV